MFRVCIACILLGGMLFAGEKKSESHHSKIRIIPQQRTPESETVQLNLVFPKENENILKQPINLQMRLRGYPLGTYSDFDKAKELRSSPLGQTVHIFIDDRPYIALNNEYEYDFNQDQEFFDQVLNYDLPFKLSQGEHIIRALPCRSFGECLKDSSAYDARVFFVNDSTKKRSPNIDLTQPYLTYNEPQGVFKAETTTPILLDFYLANCDLSSDGYKVRLTVDGEEIAKITRWVPYFMFGFTKGKHVIRLELLDKMNKLVPGEFSKVDREITIR